MLVNLNSNAPYVQNNFHTRLNVGDNVTVYLMNGLMLSGIVQNWENPDKELALLMNGSLIVLDILNNAIIAYCINWC